MEESLSIYRFDLFISFSIELSYILVTIQPPPNQLANIDFDVIGTSDY